MASADSRVTRGRGRGRRVCSRCTQARSGWFPQGKNTICFLEPERRPQPAPSRGPAEQMGGQVPGQAPQPCSPVRPVPRGAPAWAPKPGNGRGGADRASPPRPSPPPAGGAEAPRRPPTGHRPPGKESREPRRSSPPSPLRPGPGGRRPSARGCFGALRRRQHPDRGGARTRRQAKVGPRKAVEDEQRPRFGKDAAPPPAAAGLPGPSPPLPEEGGRASERAALPAGRLARASPARRRALPLRFQRPTRPPRPAPAEGAGQTWRAAVPGRKPRKGPQRRFAGPPRRGALLTCAALFKAFPKP